MPADWLADVRRATDVTLYSLVDHLPAEASEALLELATGGKPRVLQPAAAGADPFEHPDAQRRFRVMTNVEELERALEFPWEKWTIFLHPEQRQWVERDYGGPARVAGSAGTGKTIVALHRAAYLARTNPDARVLLTTFSDTLASALQTRLKRLLGNEPRLGERIDVHALDAVGLRLYRGHVGPTTLAAREVIQELLKEAADAVEGHRFGLPFLLSEWERLWTPGSSGRGRNIVTLSGWGGGRDCRRRSARSCGQFLRRCGRGSRRARLSPRSDLFTTLARALRQGGRW